MGTSVNVIVAAVLKEDAARVAEAVAALVKRRVGGLIFTDFSLSEEIRVAAETLQVDSFATLLLLCIRSQRAY